MIAHQEPDVICITEALPKARSAPIPEALLAIPNFVLYTNFDMSCQNLGASKVRGICIYIAERIHAAEVAFPRSHFSEQLWLNIKLKGEDSLLLGCIYRSPSAGVEVSVALCDIIRLASQGHTSHLLIVGDFNFGNIDWSTSQSSAPSGHPSHLFLEAVQDAFLFQHVRNPTRYRHGQCASLLDLILTNEEGMISDVSHLPGLGRSDHAVLWFHLRCYAKPKIHEGNRLALDKGDYRKMAELISEMQWENDDTLCAETSYEIFMTNLDRVTKECIPQHKKGSKKRNIYITREVMSKKKKKQKLWKTYTRSRSDEDYRRYARARNDVRKLTRELRRKYEAKLAEDIKTNPKAFWMYTNSRLKTKSGIEDLLKDDGTLTGSDEEKANVLNRFFDSVFTDEDYSCVPSLPEPWTGLVLDDLTLTPQEVEKKLRGLRPTASPGPDGVHPRVLREVAAPLSTPLSKIFQKLFESGTVPVSWKEGEVVPIFKKGSKQEASNYRPVSLTSAVSKIFESLLRDSIIEHVQLTGQLTKAQHGFLPKRSCITQLLETLEEWTRSLENGDWVDVAYLDYRKAFDAVPHQRLLKKLHDLGIRGKVLMWIKAFLTNRKQWVRVNSSRSECSAVRSGIPQGSVLGPTLFILFINDLPGCVQSSIKLFADDTKLYLNLNLHNSQDILQDDLAALGMWSSKWQMPFNVEKCKTLHLGPGNPHRRYSLRDVLLDQVTEEKDLGIFIDEELKFRKQAAAAATKANRVLGMIRRSFANLNHSTVPLLYKTMVRPLLEYGNVIWGPFNKEDQVLIERVQRRATRMVREIRHLPYPERLQILRLPSLLYRRRRGDMILMYQLMTGQLGLHREEFFSEPTTASTRGHELKVAKPRAHSRVRRNHFSVRTVNDWNSLPSHVVSSETTNKFKNSLDEFWTEHRFDIP